MSKHQQSKHRNWTAKPNRASTRTLNCNWQKNEHSKLNQNPTKLRDQMTSFEFRKEPQIQSCSRVEYNPIAITPQSQGLNWSELTTRSCNCKSPRRHATAHESDCSIAHQAEMPTWSHKTLVRMSTSTSRSSGIRTLRPRTPRYSQITSSHRITDPREINTRKCKSFNCQNLESKVHNSRVSRVADSLVASAPQTLLQHYSRCAVASRHWRP